MGLTCLCVLLMWFSCVLSARLHYDARVKLTDQGIIWLNFEHNHRNIVKLVRSSGFIWAGGSDILYSINTALNSKPKQVKLPAKNECKDKSDCTYNISLLKEGANGSTLFLCRTNMGSTMCYHMASNYSLTDPFKIGYELDINEPSLFIDNMLYFTKSDMGLYRINSMNTQAIWPQSTQTELKFVKLIAGTGRNQDKVYSFFTEKHKSASKDLGSNLWIPQVSQSCMNDKGGPKDELQSSWTSMIYARLFCGDKERGYHFTQLIDVDTVEKDNDMKIYGLFRNYWNMSAVCVYNMTEISNVFNSFVFKSSTKHLVNHQPGMCVSDSTRLSSDTLKFMKDRPEMENWVMPENGPLLFLHRHYTHIQVDRLPSHTVLFLALESGGVHKVLEERVQNGVFVIAEFQPFPQGTHITSMLLDRSPKHLYVSSGNELVQIDLQRCEVYGNDCNACVLSRDPYCIWNGLQCAPAKENSIQDHPYCMPEVAKTKTELSATASVQTIPESARTFLLCQIISYHATYYWYHGNTREECVHTDAGCLYLIESMNATHDGLYRCESSEGDYKRTVIQYELRMSGSQVLSVTPIVLLLLTMSHLLL
ncbi:semaphorin-7A-like [Myxocyprinus asiaticus]|uniref:semaphorin-7A-like n=1 Tax=Myxocyprinus asiaticus TaxID=70543 RepID=UPI0022214233|nr:semaphorin-7A-like [Myxocyprinus asiaticus]